MGYNSVVVVMNDSLDVIADDKKFGSNLSTAILCYKREPDVAARGIRRIHVNAATVVSSAHADTPQVIVVKENSGYDVWNDDVPEHVLNDLIAVLSYRGYSVKKKVKNDNY